MSAEARFILAIVLMLGVLVGGNILFPPTAPPEGEGDPVATAPTAATDSPDAAPAGVDTGALPGAVDTAVPGVPTPPSDPTLPTLTPAEELPQPAVPAGGPGERVTVEGPLYRYTFSDIGARVHALELLRFESFVRDGPVQLVADEATGILGTRVVVDADTVDLRGVRFEVTPAEGLQLQPGGAPDTLTFRYEHPTEPFSVELRYAFNPDSYLVEVSGRVQGLARGILMTDLGPGLALNEVDEGAERQSLAYVRNHLIEGIESTALGDLAGGRFDDGPFHWVALRTQYFVSFVLAPPEEGGEDYLGGVQARPFPGDEERAAVAVTRSLGTGGTFAFRFFGGPQDYAAMATLGNDAQEVNPSGWSIFRPILRPFIGAITWVLIFLHESLAIGYGWVLMLVGVLMRIILFPLNHKAMRAQLRNMAVQPLLKQIQEKYKDQPEKLQKELMKLYKEHGFNPLAGCWPMLLPWPVLIALFFVFRNTIELRGVPFAWLPDLASRDPVFILPVLLGISMFLLQWVSFRTMDEINPQMKMMMWFLPIFMIVLFATLPSGLNLYYLTANIATLPQSWWIAQERKKVTLKGPPVATVKS
ncbi:MAG: membrane protein insertase YidC [Gemmatimonadota bacterium]